MTTPPTRRKRPHPARRARRIAGSVAIAGMALLAGGMAVADKLPATSATTASATTSASTGTATTATATAAASRSVTAAAVPAGASTQSNTSTHAS